MADLYDASSRSSMTYASSTSTASTGYGSYSDFKDGSVKGPYTERQHAEAWERCAMTVKEHSDEMVKRWEDEINMLLTFAGLFSAALTAFNVQSYLLLQPDSGDATVLALAHISAQLVSFSLNQGFANSTQPSFIPPATSSFVAQAYAIWINALWFPSLVCTLSASSIAVTVKQWLYQYKQGLSGTSREIARLRQYRYENLLRWRVPEIIAVLPILLQIALSLFLVGLVILLWNLHPLVAVVSSSLVSILFVFHFATTLLPTFRPDCSYQCPQALGLFLVLQPVRRLFIRGSTAVSCYLSSSSLSRIDSAIRCLTNRLAHLFPKRGTHRRRWHAREKAAADSRRADLDRALVMTAYDVTLIDTVLHTTLGPCMWDMQPGCIRHCYDEVFGTRLKKLPWLNKDDWSIAAPLVLNFSLLAAREGPEQKVAHSDALHETVLGMPTPEVSADTEIGGLFLQTMSHLASQEKWGRRAFDKLVWYLYMTGLQDTATLRPEVIHDVIAAFPRCAKDFVAVVDYENDHLNIPYLSVAEDILSYLTQHDAVIPEDALAVEKNIQDVLLSVLAFVRFPAWRGRRSRLQYVLWELHDSGILLTVLKLRKDSQTRDLVKPQVARALRILLTLLNEELVSDSWLREFWGDKYDSVNEALETLEELYKVDELERLDMNSDTLGLEGCTDPVLVDVGDVHQKLGCQDDIASPGEVLAYPESAVSMGEYFTAPTPLIAAPGGITYPPMSMWANEPLTACPGGFTAMPLSRCVSAQPESQLIDRRDWYRQQNAPSGSNQGSESS